MFKKIISIMLCSLLVTGMFAGCTGNTTGGASSQPISSSIESKPASSEAPVTPEAAELSLFLVWNSRTYKESWPVFQEATKATGVTLKSYTSNSETDETQAYNLMISSGELADIICGPVSELEKLGGDGGMLELNDLIEKYGPNIKAFMEKNPNLAKDMYSVDGKIIALPSYVDNENLSVTEGLFIRQDWLDKLGMETPTTIEELEAVFTAFIEQDVNGNNQKDEIPFFRRADVRTALLHILQLFGSHGYFPNSAQETSGLYVEDGVIKFAPMEEEFSYAVAKAADWYKKGLIDQEIFTRGMGARDALLPSNLGGATIDWFPSTSNYNKLGQEGQVENFSFIPMPPVKMENGRQTYMYTRATNNGRGWGLSSTCKNPEAAMRILDWFFSDEGILAFNYGVEGDTYTMVNGEPQFTDKVLNNPDGTTPLEVLYSVGSQIQDVGTIQLAAYEYAVANEIAKQGYDLYMQGGYTQQSMPVLKYSSAEIDELTKTIAQMTPYIEENLQKWIMGAADFEADYDAFIATLKSMGVDRAIEINQTAYDRYMSN